MSEAAVEAAARTWFARQQASRMDAGRFDESGQPLRWSQICEQDRHAYGPFVRPVVDAALSAEGVSA